MSRKKEIIERALINHWNNDDISLEDTCREVYNKAVDEACKYIINHVDSEHVFYHENTWCDMRTFVLKMRKELGG